MTNDTLVDQFLDQFDSRATRTTYRFAINLFRDLTGDKPFATVTVSDVSDLRNALTGKPATRSTRWDGISSFFAWLLVAGYIERNPFPVVRGPRRTKNRAPEVPTDEEMHALINAPLGDGWRERRDRAIVALCANGLRVAEVVALGWADLTVKVHLTTIRVVGKGDRERIVPLSRFCARAVSDWAVGSGEASGPMFRDYARRDRPMTTRQVQSAFDRVAKACGIRGLSPHMLRAHYATRLVLAGADVFSVQKLMGHENIATTQVYVRLDLRNLMKAVSLDKLT